MRQIKFRAKVKGIDEVCTVDEIKFGGYITLKEYPCTYFQWKDIEQLLQFTGLKDNNGNEIYEGDIVKNRLGHIFKVGFYKGGFALFNEDDDEYPIFMFSEYRPAYENNLEVIRNIYKNPKLLKTKNE